jgi:Cu/Ag efflux protein CusF
MKHRIFASALAAAAAVAFHLDGAAAFSPGAGAITRVPRREFRLAQAQGQPNELFRGVGVVTAVNPATGSLTINHQEIVGLMPPMEMLFHVDPPTLSEGVKPGDKIEFQVEGKTYKIRGINVLEHGK